MPIMYRTVVVLTFLFLSIATSAFARSGCCSHHGGVCGCGCCDGTGLSSTCLPYYPQCSGGQNQTQEVYTAPTNTPKPLPTWTPVPTSTRIPTPSKTPTSTITSTPTIKQSLTVTQKVTVSPITKLTATPTLTVIKLIDEDKETTAGFWSWLLSLLKYK